MASYEKAILVFTGCDSKAITGASSPAIGKLLRKGVLLNNVSGIGDIKTLAASGAEGGGETLWDAAVAKDFVVGELGEEFDLAVVEAGNSVDELENSMAQTLGVAGRSTVVAVIGDGTVVFYGPGFAKGKVIDKKFSPHLRGPNRGLCGQTSRFRPQCEGVVAYAAFNDVNIKLKEINKLKSALQKTWRRPWSARPGNPGTSMTAPRRCVAVWRQC